MSAFVGSGIPASVGRMHLSNRCRSRIEMARAGKLRTEGIKPRKGMDNVLDDLQDRKFGRGYVFYGARKSEGDGDNDSDELGTKENSVLVTGATGEVGQWIVLALMNAGLNVRILTRRPDDAELMFGLDGSNTDVFVGDLKKDEDVKEAVDGASAIVCASGSNSVLGGNNGEAIDVEGVKKLVRYAQEFNVKKFVLLSCNAPKNLFGPSLKNKRDGEDAVRASKLSHAVLRLGKTKSEPGNVKSIDLAESSEAKGTISREDVGSVVTNLLLSDYSYIFEESSTSSESPSLRNFTATLINSNSDGGPTGKSEEVFNSLKAAASS